MKNILIADAGSTKTAWAAVQSSGEFILIETGGIHPLFNKIEEISEIVQQQVLSKLEHPVDNIFFYGAGIAEGERADRVKTGLQTVFPKAHIEAENDLLGAARSLCSDETGLVSILGTGSNSGLYDGKKIVENNTSLGYILGDEGSGSYLGKKLIADYFKKLMPADLIQKFSEEFPLTVDYTLERVYRNPYPNRFLASFCPFLTKYNAHAYVQALLNESFNTFFEREICLYKDYKNYPLSFIGSVAYYFNDSLQKVAAAKGLKVNKITKAPINDLIAYHLEH